MEPNPDFDRLLAENHEARIRTALKLQDTESLPPAVIENYWKITRVASSLGLPLDDQLLVMVVAFSVAVPAETPETFLNTVELGDVTRRDRVVARYKNRWRWGVYERINADKKVVIVFDDNPEYSRNISPTFVRLPTQKELDEIER